MNYLERAFKYPVKDWYVEHTSALPLPLSGLARGFTSGLKLKEYRFVLSYYKNGQIDWLTLIKDQNEIGKLIVAKGETHWKKEFKKWLHIKKNIEKYLQFIRKKDLSKMSDKKIMAEVDKCVGLNWEERKTSSLHDPFMFYADRKLTELLKNFIQKNPKLKITVGQAQEILTKPESPSFFVEFEADLIKIAKEIIKNPKLKNKFVTGSAKEENIGDTKISRMINSHFDKFVWIKGDSFSKGKEYTFNELDKHLSEIIGSDIKKLEAENTLWRKNKKIRQAYILKSKFNQSILNLANISSFFAKWQDLRKEDTMTNTYLLTKFVKEISKRTGVDEDYIFYLDYAEIKDLFAKKINLQDLKKRASGCLSIYGKEGKPEIFYPDEFKNFVNNIINPPQEKVSSISGNIASPGKAIGKVKVVVTLEDMNKVKKGDILVSTMTRPEHIIAMKKAAAIVTNEGGITCHAAVISRELKIPCVIGTKIATRVLRDGNLVEVDADAGIIKIIHQ